MIFINHRQADTGPYASLLKVTLTALLGPGKVFLDVDEIPPGTNITTELKKVLGRTTVLLALIGPKWESCTNPDGTLRLADRHDAVRLELRAALRLSKVRVVPILIEREALPKPSDVPPVFASFLELNAFAMRRPRWEEDVAALLRRLKIKTHQHRVDGASSAQARMVSASVEWKRRPVPDSIPRRWVVYIDNASDAPIAVKAVVVKSRKSPTSSLTIDWGTVQPKTLSDYELDETDFNPTGDRPAVRMQFLDAEGQSWTWRNGIVEPTR